MPQDNVIIFKKSNAIPFGVISRIEGFFRKTGFHIMTLCPGKLSIHHFFDLPKAYKAMVQPLARRLKAQLRSSCCFFQQYSKI